MKRYIDGIEMITEEADRYIQINDITGPDLSRVWEKIASGYTDYEKWFCYHNTDAPLELLGKIGAVLVDDNVEMRLNAHRFDDADTPVVMQVTEKDFEEFAARHDIRHPGMYWTSQRIRRDLSRWGIFAVRSDSGISGYILLCLGNSEQSEIFCIDALNFEGCAMLIKRAAKYAFANGYKEVLFMADFSTASHEAALSVGFSVTGFYKGYAVRPS